MKRLVSLFLTAIMLFSLVACGNNTIENSNSSNTANTENNASSNTQTDSTQNGDVFRIGTYLQLTGSNALAGNDAKRSIDLAAKYINENGGFNGATLVVEHFDTQGSNEEAVKVVQRMLAGDNYDAIIGSVNSNEVSACIGYINEAKVYNFGLGTSATWMDDDSMIYTFRASANNGRIAPFDVDVIQQLGYDSVAIINGTDDTGASTADAFEAACEEKRVTVTTCQHCDSEDTDFTGQITQIMDSDPDCIFMSTIGQTTGPFVKQVRNMGYKGMICFKDCFSQEYQTIAGPESSNYVFFAYPYVVYENNEDCDIENVKAFLDLFSEEYGEQIQHESAYRGWDTMMTMWEASKIAGANDDESLREATNQVKTEGLGGTLDYTAGDREGYSQFNSFVLVDGMNIPLSDWIENGGYDDYLAATGRDR